MIARLMQEEEDLLRAQELQNDYYSGNRPPTAAATRGGGNARGYDDGGAAGYRAPDADRMERLIPDSRQELFGDDWEMNEHVGSGMRNHHIT